MTISYRDYLVNHFNIDERVIDLIEQTEAELKNKFIIADDITSVNQLKVLKAFQDNNINATHFDWNTGYGYDDPGRAAVERVFASIFNTETALVRPNIVNGTHAIATTLQGLLKPGDELIYASGAPYDTLETVLGKNSDTFMGTIMDYGVIYNEVPLNEKQELDLEAIERSINERTRIIAIQRSTGYDFRPAIPLADIKAAASLIHSVNKDIIVFVDNCYGEFVDTYEPTDIGVDVMAGSLIKNPGGGLALSGGYIAGRRDLIDLIQYRLTCPGIGAECGLTYGQNRNVLQGIFIAPRVVNSAVRAAMLLGAVYDKLGFEVCPAAFSDRSDIVQAVKFLTPDRSLAFCQAIQAASPIDSYVTPMPWEMPGYQHEVVMASGSFVQGSSIEMSADGPMREPYIAYYQGGLTYEHARYGIISSVDSMLKKNLISV